MALFKFRKAVDEQSSASTPAQTIESIREKAKYRLAGASVLVLLGVIGFPLLFDKQPRPIPVDTPIDIPDRAKVLPLAIPPSPVISAGASAAQTAPASPTASTDIITEADVPASAPVQASKPAVGLASAPARASIVAAVPAVAATALAASSAPDKTAKQSSANSMAGGQEAARVQALLEGRSVTASKPTASAAVSAADGGRFVVQVGAFADTAHAQEVRLKLERAGLKTYTQVAQTKDGPRIRVRLGPFSSKMDAQRAAASVKKLNLPAALLTL